MLKKFSFEEERKKAILEKFSTQERRAAAILAKYSNIFPKRDSNRKRKLQSEEDNIDSNQLQSEEDHINCIFITEFLAKSTDGSPGMIEVSKCMS